MEMLLQEQELDLAQTKNILKKVSHIYLAITGKPVIHKKLSRYYEHNHELVNVLLPDAKTGDFTAQCFEMNGSFYGCIMRKDLLEQVMAFFSSAKLFPETVLIGPYALSLLPVILQEDIKISTSAYDVLIENKHLQSIQAAAETSNTLLNIGGEKANSFNLTGLCLCLQAQVKAMLYTSIDDAMVKTATGEALQKRKFKKLLALSVVLLLLMVGSNFFANQHYAEKYARLDEQLALNRQVLTEIEKLERDIAEKRSLLGQRPGSNGPVISMIGDQLAATVPTKIKLQNLEIFPVNGKISKEKPIAFSFNKVLVEGISSESEVLDNWISQCKKFDWVKEVQIVKYNFDHEKRKGLFKLELLLQ